MTSYIIYKTVNNKKTRVDEVVFLNSMSNSQVKAALIADGYDPKTLTFKKTYM